MKKIISALVFACCFAACASAGPAVFVQSDSAAGPGSDLQPTLTLNEDGSFVFHVNLYEGMGNVFGTYKLIGKTYHFKVASRDFSGFIGDDVDEFSMERSESGDGFGDRLIFLLDREIGATEGGSVFYRVSPIAQDAQVSRRAGGPGAADGDVISELNEQKSCGNGV